MSRSSLTLFLGCLLLVGCGSKSDVRRVDAESLRGRLRFDNILVAQFTADSGVPEPQGPLAQCREGTIAQLRSKNLFQHVGDAPAPTGGSSAKLEANIKQMRIVSGSARFWGGSLAGRSHMLVHVRLTDAATGAVIAEEDVEGAPNAMGSSWSLGGTDRALPREMGALIGEWVLNYAGR